MKTCRLPLTALAFIATLVSALPVRAQVFRPETVGGAVLGAGLGAIIGNNGGDHNGGRGALIGAIAGGLLGAVTADEHARRTPVTVSAPRNQSVLGPVLLGGLTGAIIGNNSGTHNPWRGAAFGAGAGYILGRIGERAPRHAVIYPPTPAVVYAPVVAPTPVLYVTVAPAVAAPAPQSVTIINNYYYTSATPMSAANAMFGR